MDPTSALQELRWSLEDLENEVKDGPEQIEIAFERVKEHFDNLDGWLSRKGLLPSDWSRE